MTIVFPGVRVGFLCLPGMFGYMILYYSQFFLSGVTRGIRKTIHAIKNMAPPINVRIS